MSIPTGLRRPGVYTDINTNTQRSGLPDNRQRVLFVTESSGTFNTTNIITLNASLRFTSAVNGANKAYIKYARLLRINNP